MTEAYVTRPVLTAAGASPCDRLSGQVELSFEGLTLRRGELNAGIYGEGYYDRRHPHTMFHDVTASVRLPRDESSRVRVSATAGRGFAPFGTDEPMSRPFLKFPANHHLAQLLERVVAIGAIGLRLDHGGDLALEVGTFNGDDPVGPFSAPRWRRFGDSWSTRATIAMQRFSSAIELQGSYADVRSPDIAFGGGLDQRKRSISARFENSASRRQPYVLAEFATTTMHSASARAFAYGTWLAEGSVRHGPSEMGLRVERTDRPEDERERDPFRSPRPPHDFMNLGITRWWAVSARAAPSAARSMRAGNLTVASFIEATIAAPRALLRGSVFDPNMFYGRSWLWTGTIGARLGFGSATHRRMGRYGASVAPPVGVGSHQHGM